MTSFEFEIPIATISRPNATRQHWVARAKMVRGQRDAVRLLWPKSETVRLPAVVCLTRVAPRKLDSDNLEGALKAIRDAAAEIIGVDDGREDLIGFAYEQEKGKPAVRVKVISEARVETRVVAAEVRG